MQLFIAMNGCAGDGWGRVGGMFEIRACRYNHRTLHTMPAGLGGWGWVGGKSPEACMQQVGRTTLHCLLSGLVGRGWLGGMSQINDRAK